MQRMITTTLANYAARRGYTGEPMIRMVCGDSGKWRESIGWTGTPPTIVNAAEMQREGITRVEVCWREATADFHIFDLTAKVGIAAHGEVVEL